MRNKERKFLNGIKNIAVIFCISGMIMPSIAVSAQGSISASSMAETSESIIEDQTLGNTDTVADGDDMVTPETELDNSENTDTIDLTKNSGTTESEEVIETTEPPETKDTMEIDLKESEDDVPEETEEMNESEPQAENSWRFENGVWIGAYSMFSDDNFTPWTRIDGYYVNGSGSIIRDAVARGIDVSEWQGDIQWDKVAADDVSFAILRCGAGQSYVDKKWDYNRAECERLGIPYGVYLYSYAQSPEDAQKEAEHVLELVEGSKLSYPIYYDLEDNTISVLGNEEIAEIAKAFCDVIETAGYKVQIYANLYWMNNYLTDPYFERFGAGKWVAQYNDRCDYRGSYNIWQCSSTGRVDGINGNVDIDFIMKETLYPNLANKELYVNSKWYYIDDKGDLSKGWVKHHGNTYYYDDYGVMQKNIVRIDGKYYGFNEWTGVLLKGEHYFTDGSDDHWYYFDEKTGVMQTGWVKHHNSQYYYNDQGQMQYDEKYLDGYWYYFNEWTGVMATGWTTHHNEWYYYDASGHMIHGEKYMDGHWYYFDEYTGITANKGFTYHHDHWYYYNDYGYMQYGEKYIDGDWYYFDPYLGIMATGWTKHHGNTYYYDEEGRMYHGRQVIDGKTYEFDTITGVLKK